MEIMIPNKTDNGQIVSNSVGLTNNNFNSNSCSKEWHLLTSTQMVLPTNRNLFIHPMCCEERAEMNHLVIDTTNNR